MEVIVREDRAELLPEPSKVSGAPDLSEFKKVFEDAGVPTEQYGLFLIFRKPVEMQRPDAIEKVFARFERMGFSVHFSHTLEKILSRREEDPFWSAVFREYRRVSERIYKRFFYRLALPRDLHGKIWELFVKSLVPWSFAIRHFDIPVLRFSGKFSFVVLRFWSFAVWFNPRASYTFKYIKGILPSLFSGPTAIKFPEDEVFP